MTVNYKGKDANFDYRIAEISYNEDREEERVTKLVDYLYEQGWDISIVTPGYAQCLVEDMDEYKEFIQDWKAAKKAFS